MLSKIHVFKGRLISMFTDQLRAGQCAEQLKAIAEPLRLRIVGVMR